ncbi:hypothetical protein [Actinoplanes siamensis]|uniref:Uncharacterized protein n=1 Tax=Actinoplanes siamensis TaxID=1223317 RepID=A0A919NAG9_9ACTN|nr:hypothetical protein [Actinoplanes siamensis]GIF07513.1 hypothetical protein Asi03nite_50510 [Actinoplanes siamensis]
MADTEPGPHTPATGLPAPSEEPTGVLPSRWSGAAPVPEIGPRKSLWERLVGKVGGEPPEPHPDDYWATVPAVDPWAGQDTPVWTTEQLIPAAPATMPPTLVDNPVATPPTRVDTPAGTRTAAPADPAADPGKVELPAKIRALVDALSAKAAEVEKTRAAKARAAGAAPTAVPPKPPATPAPKKEGWFRRAAATPKAGPAPGRVPVPPRPQDLNRPPFPRPPRPRRPRRRLRRLLLVITVLAAMWFGAPLAYDRWPTLAQFPVTASLPERIGDLELRADDASRRAVDRLADQLTAAGSEGQAFAGVYGDGDGKRVTVYGVTGWRFTPQSDLNGQLARISGDVRLTGVRDFPLAASGAYQTCGAGRLNGTSTVICTWADHGSMATVLLTRRSVQESAELVARLRGEVLTPRFGA